MLACQALACDHGRAAHLPRGRLRREPRTRRGCNRAARRLPARTTKRGASAARLTPLESTRRRRGLKVAVWPLSLHRGCLAVATFARRLRVGSTFGLRRMPASRKPAYAGHETTRNLPRVQFSISLSWSRVAQDWSKSPQKNS